MGEDIILGLLVLLPCLSAWGLVLFYRRLRQRQAPVGWRQLLVGNSLLLFLLVSLLCLAGEVYFRFVYDSTDSFMYSKVSRRWTERYWHWNKADIRDTIEYSLKIQSGMRRVSFVGDSFTAGHGVKNVEDRFVNRIRHAHPEWEIHMLAMPGNDTGDELTFLQSSLAKGYQADRVVLVYCLNDISDIIPERRRAIDRINSEIQQSGWIRRNSYFVDILFHRIGVRRNPFMRGYFDLVQDAYRGGLWEVQKQRLKMFRDLIESHGGKLAVVTFPFLHAGANDRYQFVHDELGQFWRELGVPHLDLLPVYRQLSPEKVTVNRFDAHPNEFAHALAAPVIEKFVAEQLTGGTQHHVSESSPK